MTSKVLTMTKSTKWKERESITLSYKRVAQPCEMYMTFIINIHDIIIMCY